MTTGRIADSTDIGFGMPVKAPMDALVENYSPVYSSSILRMETQFIGSSVEV